MELLGSLGGLEFLGWISSLLLGVCAIPQGLKTLRTRTARDISWAFLSLWGGGEVVGIAYAYGLDSTPLLFNYVLNTIIIGYILYVKVQEGSY